MASNDEGGGLTPLQQALIAMREMRARLDVAEAAAREPIAVVGAGLRLPGGVVDLDSYADLLFGGVDAVRPVPADRWDADRWTDPDPDVPGRMIAREAGFLDDVAGFDAAFFGISPREALEIDPTQRLLLMTAWEALEHAGFAPDRLAGTATGVWVGLGLSDYGRRHFLGPDPTRMTAWSGTGSFLSVASGRVAYTLGLQGPAVTVDTACSSSLVAIHLAAASLRARETDLALAGGANLLIAPEPSVYFSKLAALSPDGRSKAFDAAADGYGRGEGVALVALQRLGDAVRDGRRILAVLRGSAINQDGRTNGLTAPSGRAQQAVIRAALAAAGAAPVDVDLVEAHGTGTPLGDPIEMDALKAVYGAPDARPLWVGSVKTQIGHLETAAGVAGLLKLVVALRAGRVPPQRYGQTPNPRLGLGPTRIRLATDPADLPSGRRALAAVSSFGLSGTNAHVVLEAPPEAHRDAAAPIREAWPVAISARGGAALAALAARWADRIEAGQPLGEVAQTALRGRAALPDRLTVAGAEPAEVAARLRAFARGEEHGGASGTAPSAPPSLVFLFTGQGAQHPGMGLRMAEAFPVFGAALREAAALADPHLPRPLCDVLWEDGDDIHDTRYTQPALFAYGWALAALWRSLGVQPDAAMGHSVGEIVAAAVSGALAVGPAMRLVCARGRLMSELPRDGSMLAVFAPLAEVERAIGTRKDVSVSGVNGPSETVLSGRVASIDVLADHFRKANVRTRHLTVSHAFHSPLMDPILDAFEEEARALIPGRAAFPVISNVDGRVLGDRAADPHYWRRHLREAVRFQQSMEALRADGHGVYLEIGPNPTLSGLGARLDGRSRFVASTREEEDDEVAVLHAAGALWAAGVDVDWPALIGPGAPGEGPAYPWQTEPFWLPPVEAAGRRDPLDGAVLEVAWVPAPVATPSVPPGSWLVIGPADSFATDVAGELIRRGHEARVVEDLLAIGQPELAGVVDCRGAAAVDATAAEGGLGEALERVAGGTLRTLRAAASARSAPRVWLVTRGAFEGGTAPSDLASAGAHGAFRVGSTELGDRVGGALDVEGDVEVAEVVDRLLDPRGEVLRLREGTAWVARLQRVSLPEQPLSTGAGTWLVTGGWGDLGRRVLQTLVEQGVRSLVVVSRSGCATDAARALRDDLTGRGLSIDDRALDVRDGASIRALVGAIEDLGGVVHCAGAAADAALSRVDWDDVTEAVTGKAAGAWNLHLALAFHPVPFVLFSSAAAVVGTAGQAAYAAANAVIDAVARARRAMGLPATSVAFGPWAGDGLAARVDAATKARWSAEGVALLDAAAGDAAWLRAAASDHAHVVVAPFDWERYAASRPGPAGLYESVRAPAAAVAAPSTLADDLPARLRALPEERRSDAVAAEVSGLVGAVLGLSAGRHLDPDTGFFDAGLDSLMAVELRNRVGRRFGLDLSPTVAFDHPNVRALVRHVLEALGFQRAEAARPTSDGPADEPVAIVGCSLRMPGGADSLDAFTRFLLDGTDAITAVPPDRFDVEAWYDPVLATPGRLSCRDGGFVAGIEDFEPAAFGITPREAASLDPQQRMLLEGAWEALEDAAIPPLSLIDASVGVFVGIGTSEYWRRFEPTDAGAEPDPYNGTGNEPSFAAGRISYVFGLRGPSMSINTACSSSLVALHQAAASLRDGSCRLALAGGVNAIVGPETTILMSQLRALAPDGRCKTFDASANGYVRSEGCGMVVLERLSDALAAGHRILGVLRGSAVNHDGRSSGLTVPSGPAQAEVVRAALKAAAVAPAELGYLECHGTGTSLGDPIEVGALRSVLATGRAPDDPLRLGAVKSHVGHLEAGAGMAGLFAVLGALRTGRVPPVLHLSSPNPSLPLDWPVHIPDAAMAWPRPDGGRIAGVSSFGISGTNAHVVLSEAPASPPPPEPGARPLHLVTLSARTPAGVAALATRLIEVDARIDDIAYTLNAGRTPLSARVAVTAEDTSALAAALAPVAAGRGIRTAEAVPPRLVFLCTGAGPQQAGMARALYDVDATFRSAFDACCDIAAPLLDVPLRDVVFPENADDRLLHELRYTQPALFAVEWAMAKLWEKWGVTPDALIGHSTGQYIAATLAGVFSLDDGMRLMCQRAALMSSLPHDGEMVAVFAPAATVAEALAGHEGAVAIGAVNGPAETVISGLREPVNAIADRFEAAGVEIRRLRISHAAHSPQMDSILDPFAALVGRVTLHRPSRVLVENVRGEVAGDDIVTPAYWRTHMRQGVQFLAGMKTLAGLGYRHFLELGNHPILSGAGGRCLDDLPCAWYPSLRRGEPDWTQLLGTLGRMWEAGVPVDWEAFHADMKGARIGLPVTQWQRRRHWVERTERAAASLPGEGTVYRTVWTAAPSVERPLPGPVLVLPDAGGLSRAVGLAGAVVRDDLDAGDALAVAAAAKDAGAASIAWFGALDAPDSGADPTASARAAARGALGVATAAARLGVPVAWVTRGASPGSAPVHAGQAATWGFGNAVAVEMPDLDLRRVDLDPSGADAGLADALRSGLDVVAVRDGVLRVPRLVSEEPLLRPAPAFAGTVLVTGGLGAIGRRIAAWVVERGAPAVVLVGRRAPSEAAAAELARLATRARIEVVAGDVSTAAGVDAVLADVASRDLPPLRSLFHAAGVLDDAAFLSLDDQRLVAPWGPKVAGTAALDRRLQDVDHFVVFSSAAASIGSPGQANYAAGNAVMDALVANRRARGLAAQSVAWGPWAEAGLATEARRAWEAGGVRPMAPATCVAVLERMLGSGDAVVSVVSADWPTFCGRLSRVPGLLADLAGTAAAVVAAHPLRAALAATDAARRPRLAADLVAAEVAGILGLTPSDIPHDKGFFDIGFDSLMAVEFRARLKDGFGVSLPATVAFDHPNVTDLADFVLGLLAFEDRAQAPDVAVVTRSVTYDEPIAIVGMACRYPGGSDDPEAFWRLLREGRDPVGEVPADRWDVDAWYDPRPGTAGRMVTRQGAFLDGVDQFDPEFFQIAPREAMSMDPQQRLFLEVAWEALEDAGLTNRNLRDSRSGVFVGAGDGGYLDRFHVAGEPVYRDTYAGTGNLSAFVAGRTAYVLGVHGPTFTLNTACSSTLVATHLAAQALRTGDCDTALAGGVHLMLSPENFVYVSQLKALSPDGRCKTFDARADGYGRSEGCGVLVLRRLSDAQRDGDSVLAILRGTAVNHDGASSGLTVPNGAAQQAVIRAALERSDVDPLDVSYVEAHGTGTVLGDPIEVHALEAELCRGRGRDRLLHVGAVKSNVGHMEVAAGSASLVKMVLALQHREFPPHLHFTSPNPDIELERLPIAIDTVPTAWEPIGGRRIAGVSAFGLSGTNAHVVLEEAPFPAPPPPAPEADRPCHLLVLSARRPEALHELAQRFADRLDGPDALADVAFSAATTRMPFERRLAVVAPDAAAARTRLLEWRTHGSAPGVTSGTAPSRPPRVVWLFSGQGSQIPGMGAALRASQPAFRDMLDRCARAADGLLPRPLLDAMADEDVHDTRYTQPALFAYELAAAALWTSIGLRPDAVIGHSIGEIAAAAFAGVLTVEDGMKLVCARGGLMADLPRGGSMYAAFAGEARVREACAGREGRVSIAAVNNPGETVLSGPEEDVRAVADALKADGVDGRMLTVSHAFHSSLMDGILDPFEAVAAGLRFGAPTLPLVLNGTGAMADGRERTARYWRDHVRGAVRFHDGVRTLLDSGHDLFVEVGPHPTLLGNVKRSLPSGDDGAVLLPTGRRDGDPDAIFLTAVGGAWCRGAGIDWKAYEAGRARRRLKVPHTPFVRRRIWLDAPEFPSAVDRVGSWLYEPVWRDLMPAPARPATGRWVVLGDGGLGAPVAAELTRRGAAVERADAPGAVMWNGVEGVVLLTALDGSLGTPELLRRAVGHGPGVALEVVRAVAGRHCPLVLVTRGAADTGDGAEAPQQAPLLGFGRVVQLEHPEIGVRMVDVGDADATALLDAALSGDDEPEVALRGGRRLVRRLVRSQARGAPPGVRADRSYLVSGGLGALGLLVAEWLVAEGAGEVVLTSRSEPSAEVAARLEALRTGGALVVVARGDVARRSDVDRIVAGTFHPVGGVVHAAGVLADGALLRMDADRLEAPFPPKRDGAWNLHEATRGQPVEFFVLYSGGASLLGSPGQANYAAANAFLDAFASWRRRQGLPATSLAWGAWAEVGMAASLGDAHAARQAAEGIDRLPPAAGVRALARLCRADAAQVGVLRVDWDRFVGAMHGGSAPPLLRELVTAPKVVAPTAAPAPAATRGLTALDAALAAGPDRATALDRFVTERVVAVLGLDRSAPIDAQKPLLEMGLDSLLAIELKNALDEGGVNLPVARIMTGPSIAIIRQMVAVELDGRAQPADAPVGAPVAAASEGPTLNPVATHLAAVIVGMLFMAGVALFLWVQAAREPDHAVVDPVEDAPRRKR